MDSALGHHGHEVPVAQPAGDVPANAEFDDLGLDGNVAVTIKVA